MIHHKIFILIGPSLVYEYNMQPNLNMCIGIIIFILHVDFYTNYKRQIIMSLLVIFYFIVNNAIIDNLDSNCF